MNPRRRNTMEDVHRIIENLLGEDDSFSLLGVYDGICLFFNFLK
jgi:hypothetical protein